MYVTFRANLNKSYFTNRQDRYLHFASQKDLARYCFDFIQTVTTFSYKLLPASPSPTPHLPSLNPHTYTYEDYTLHWPNPDTHPHHINALAESALSQFQKCHRERLAQSLPTTTSPPTENAFLVPIIQAGQFNIREEETTFESLFRLLSQTSTKHRPLLDLTSGYFSLYTPYQNFILNAKNLDCRIVASSPKVCSCTSIKMFLGLINIKANGFFGSKGISGRIPEGYTLYEQRFMSAVLKAGRLWSGLSPTDGQGVLLSEWEKPGWTYHAKGANNTYRIPIKPQTGSELISLGIWLSPSPSTPPVLTLFGSTNLNSRSAHIDTELSFLIIIPSEGQPPSTESSASGPSPLLSLRQDLFREIKRIRANSGEWNGAHRKVRWTTKIIVWLVKGML